MSNILIYVSFFVPLIIFIIVDIMIVQNDFFIEENIIKNIPESNTVL